MVKWRFSLFRPEWKYCHQFPNEFWPLWPSFVHQQSFFSFSATGLSAPPLLWTAVTLKGTAWRWRWMEEWLPWTQMMSMALTDEAKHGQERAQTWIPTPKRCRVLFQGLQFQNPSGRLVSSRPLGHQIHRCKGFANSGACQKVCAEKECSKGEKVCTDLLLAQGAQ